jgi:hypothetical protein
MGIYFYFRSEHEMQQVESISQNNTVSTLYVVNITNIIPFLNRSSVEVASYLVQATQLTNSMELSTTREATRS